MDQGDAGTGRAMQPLAPVTRAAELLPPSSLVVMDFAGPARLAEIIGRDALVRQFSAEYREVTAQMAETVGVDLLDPVALAGIGVDIGGRMGVAVISSDPVTVAVYGSLTDPGRFRQFVVSRMAGRGEVRSVPMAGAELIGFGDAALVLRGPLAMLVFGEGAQAAGDVGLAIATADPNVALANDRAFRRVTGGVAPADWTTYLDAGAIWAGFRRAEAKRRLDDGSWAQEEVERAKSTGAPPERIAELEAEAESAKQWASAAAARRQAELDLVDRVIGGAGRVVWSMSSKPGGLVGEGQLELGADGLLMKALRNHPGSPALPKALSGRPLAMLSGAVDVAEIVALLDQFLRADELSWEQAVAEAKRNLDLDLDAELRPLLTGTAAIAMTFDGKAGAPFEGPEQLGLAIDLELADPDKAAALLDRVGTRLETERRKRKDVTFTLRKDAKHGSWAVGVPQWRTVHVSVAGQHLVISTDPALGERLAGGVAGDAVQRGQSSAIAAATLPGAALGGLVDIEMLSMLFLARTSGFPFSSVSTAEDAETAEAPKSKAYLAKQRQLAAAEAKANLALRAEEREQLVAWSVAMAPWGSLALGATKHATGLSLSGGQFVAGAGGIAGALLASAQGLKAMSERPSSESVTAAFVEIDGHRRELDAIRQRDITAWRARQPKAKSGRSVAVPGAPAGD